MHRSSMQCDPYNDADAEDPVMKAITLRNVPPEITRVVRKRATEKRQSLNKAVLELLAEGAGLKKPAKKLHTDLDALSENGRRRRPTPSTGASRGPSEDRPRSLEIEPGPGRPLGLLCLAARAPGRRRGVASHRRDPRQPRRSGRVRARPPRCRPPPDQRSAASVLPCLAPSGRPVHRSRKQPKGTPSSCALFGPPARRSRTNDASITASTMQHGLTVLTTDADFLRIPQILVDHHPTT